MVLSEEQCQCATPRVHSSHPIPQPKWGYSVAQKDLCRLQPLHDVVQRLLRGGMMGMDLLQTFVSRHIQPLRQ
jgi:hypothetical protein